MSDFDFNNIEDLKAEEKRLYEEYKAKLSELKKVQKEKEAVGQVFTKGLTTYICSSYIKVWANKR